MEVEEFADDTCDNSRRCYNSSLDRCDNINDCDDRADEDGCSTGEYNYPETRDIDPMLG